MATFANMGSRLAKERTVIELVALCVFAGIVFGGLGIAARRRVAPLRAQEQTLKDAMTQVDAFRAAFRASGPDEIVRMTVPESLVVSTPRDLRVTLAEKIATLAEQSRLTDVRVWFTPGADSAAPPRRPDMVRSPVDIANYILSVDCTGSYGSVLALVRELPPSVALERLTAVAATNGKSQFHLSLAIFESASAPSLPSTDKVAQHG